MRSDRKTNKEELVIGLDCSTTSTKAIAFNKHGKVIASAHQSIPLYSPRPSYYEQDVNDWWSSVQKTLRNIIRQVNPEKISALAISNQRETFVALDKNGNCLRPAIIWLDERCKDEVETFSKRIGKSRIHRITGKPVDYAPVVYRLAWLKRNEPDLYKNIKMICDVHTFIVWKLTGEFKTSWASADPLGLFDLKNKKWSSLILRALKLGEDQLPQTYCSGSILGKVSQIASRLTGLSTNTLIIGGGGDGQCAGTGANALSIAHAYLNLGTAVVSGVYGKQYRTGEAFRTMCSCTENGYYYECSLRAGTFAIDWFIKNILKIDPIKQTGIYKQLQNEAVQINAGSEGLFFLPYICGVMNPYWDMNARGAFIGLSSSHKQGHMYRAILEGIAFEQLFAINAVEKSISRSIKDFIAIGGGVNNKLWCQILADITGKNIRIPKDTEASGLGAAIAAAVGIGWYRSFKDAADAMTGIHKTIKPQIQNHKKYQQLFLSYKSIYPHIKDLIRL